MFPDLFLERSLLKYMYLSFYFNSSSWTCRVMLLQYCDSTLPYVSRGSSQVPPSAPSPLSPPPPPSPLVNISLFSILCAFVLNLSIYHLSLMCTYVPILPTQMRLCLMYCSSSLFLMQQYCEDLLSGHTHPPLPWEMLQRVSEQGPSATDLTSSPPMDLPCVFSLLRSRMMIAVVVNTSAVSRWAHESILVGC